MTPLNKPSSTFICLHVLLQHSRVHVIIKHSRVYITGDVSIRVTKVCCWSLGWWRWLRGVHHRPVGLYLGGLFTWKVITRVQLLGWIKDRWNQKMARTSRIVKKRDINPVYLGRSENTEDLILLYLGWSGLWSHYHCGTCDSPQSTGWDGWRQYRVVCCVWPPSTSDMLSGNGSFLPGPLSHRQLYVGQWQTKKLWYIING